MNINPMTPQMQTFDHLASAITINALDIQQLIRDWPSREAWAPVMLDRLRRAQEMLDTAVQALDEVVVSLTNRMNFSQAAE